MYIYIYIIYLIYTYDTYDVCVPSICESGNNKYLRGPRLVGNVTAAVVVGTALDLRATEWISAILLVGMVGMQRELCQPQLWLKVNSNSCGWLEWQTTSGT